MGNKKNIFLVGPQGAGKTTIGRQLAKATHQIFYDSDHEIEKATGVSIATIFEVETESGFRKREQDMIAKLTQLDNIILSTGGGTIETAENCNALTKHGIVIYLCASLATQLKRTNQRKGIRPLLDVPDPMKKIIELHHKREPLYKAIAHHTYDTDKQTPKAIVEHVVATLFQKA